ncbi:carboxymuconolactone decarboxylase family protein [Rhodococcus sp. NPDC049939]|uniref:carboxymuconolactone decarboxylase family protein n=1 Tax=Rhodococcus sp. NPDC049939 TaxID=3155511 RepID=UPI0033FE51CD
MTSTPEDPAETRDERFARGLKIVASLHGERGQKNLESLAEASPELSHQITAWAYGDIYGRPGLSLRDRQLLTVGMLTALGGCESLLTVHINAALNIGLKPEEILEALLHSAVYCGMPKAMNATFVAKDVFTDRGILPMEQ